MKVLSATWKKLSGNLGLYIEKADFKNPPFYISKKQPYYSAYYSTISSFV